MVGKSRIPEDPLGQGWGRGPRNEHGLYAWYEYPPEITEALTAPDITWSDLFDRWELVEADFASHYHLDLMSELPRRTARWLKVRLRGLLSADTRTRRSLAGKIDRR